MLDDEAAHVFALPHALDATGAEMDAGEDPSVDGLRGSLRKTVVASRAARCRERVMDRIGVEIPAQYLDRRARIRRQAARIVRVQRRDEQR